MRRLTWAFRLTDLSAFWLAVLLGFHLRFSSGLIPIFTLIPGFSLYLHALLILSPLYVLLMEALGNYQDRHGRLSTYEVQNLYRSLVFFYLLCVAITFFLKTNEFSRVTMILVFFLNFLLGVIFRACLVQIQQEWWKAGREIDRVLIVGKNQALIDQVRNAFDVTPESGYRVVDTRVLEGNWKEFDPAKVDRVVVAGGDADFNDIADLISGLPNRIRVDLIPTYYLFLRHLPFKEFVGNFPLLPLNQQTIPGWNTFIKRVMDISLSAILLILLLPLMALISLLIRLLYGPPVLFRQERVGQNGRLFSIYKFRTMRVDAPEQMLAMMAEHKQANYKWKQDPRVLGSFARLLRRTSMDELPQLRNVLQGSMSLVGPRPAPVEFVRNYSPYEKLRLALQPGLTGLQQVYCRGSESMEDILKYDLRYMTEQSIWLDLLILAKTVRSVFSGKGAH